MIRPATFSDIPAMAKLVHNSHARSKYAPRTDINAKALEQLLMGLVAGQNQNGPGATHITVCERQGKVTGFMAGAINRIYNIGEKLSASDLFLINDANNVGDTMKLIDDYIDWAHSNPKVIEVGLSWTDATNSGHVIRKLYKRKGFRMAGEQFVIETDQTEARAA